MYTATQTDHKKISRKKEKKMKRGRKTKHQQSSQVYLTKTNSLTSVGSYRTTYHVEGSKQLVFKHMSCACHILINTDDRQATRTP